MSQFLLNISESVRLVSEAKAFELRYDCVAKSVIMSLLVITLFILIVSFAKSLKEIK